ncbi:hypothetical protein NEMBOFW57_007453 [Staphylotrichum longicolle]|uniref:Uncharacterized protein n=1 Tax=Staphylotrichum longicolle TaxID=669026 RepID=A0AAD4EV93_9PEZI|nr:hypothetical protein NEMBOFW57_007453 [Staphylotrichum longicolle]
MRSDGGRAFKDILDAQSEIKPADFRTRVQAAGARDYGEDVAERNMGQNGVDLDATHVRAFYAQSEGIHGPRRRASLMETGSRAGRAGVRRRSLLSIQHTPPRHPMPPSPKRNGTRDLGRRRSVNTYMPLDYGGENLLPRSDRDTLAALPPRVCGPGAKQLDFGFSALGLAAPSAAHALETAPAPIVRTTRRPRDSVVLAKQRVLETTAEDAIGYPPPIRTRSMRGWSASSETPTAPESIAATSITTTTSTFHRPPSLHTADTSVDLSIGAGSPQLKHSRSFSRPGSAVHDASSDYDTDEHTQEVRLRDAEGAHRLTRPISEFNIDDYLSSSSSRSEDDDGDGDNDDLHHPPLNPNNKISTTTDTAVHHNLLLPPELQQQTTTTTTTNPEMDESHDRDHFNIDDYLSSDAASMTTPNRRPTAEGEEELLFDDGGGFGFGAGGEVGLPGLGEALPFPLPLVEQGGGGGGGGADGRKNGQAREEGWHRATRMRRQYVLDTAADDESESEFDSDWGGEGGVGGRRRRHLHGQPDGRPRTAHMDADSDEDGYEADFVDDDDDYDQERQTRRRNGNRQTERLSALCRLEGREDEARRQLSQQNGDLEDKVTAAVRLRKEAKRARRLAGQPSPAMLRRKAMPVPVLHIDGAAV